MNLQRCNYGHYFDPAKHTSCPHCGVPNIDLGKTDPQRKPSDDQHTQPKEQWDDTDPGDSRTQGIIVERTGIDPVVGWLVCIDGPGKGMDYRIRSERNSIGRSNRMRICIDQDEAISRENHAFLSYDPRGNSYTLIPGTATGIVYLNDEELVMPRQLKPFDKIMLGRSTLLFIPLCGNFGGSEFRWM